MCRSLGINGKILKLKLENFGVCSETEIRDELARGGEVTEGEKDFQARAGGAHRFSSPLRVARENANVGFSEFPWEGFVRPDSASFWLCLALRCKPQHAGGADCCWQRCAGLPGNQGWAPPRARGSPGERGSIGAPQPPPRGLPGWLGA